MGSKLSKKAMRQALGKLTPDELLDIIAERFSLLGEQGTATLEQIRAIKEPGVLTAEKFAFLKASLLDLYDISEQPSQERTHFQEPFEKSTVQPIAA